MLDLLATSYEADLRPLPLAPAHVSSYLARAAAGQDPLAPLLAPAAALASDQGGPGAAAAAAGGADAPPVDGWQLLFEGQDLAGCVSLDADDLDFGSVSRLSPGSAQSFTVRNHTGAKLVVWAQVPGWSDPSSAGDAEAPKQVGLVEHWRTFIRASLHVHHAGSLGRRSCCGMPRAAVAAGRDLHAPTSVQVFEVVPARMEVPPHGTATFRVAFRPPADRRHYSQELRLCACAKLLRNFRLAGEAQLLPPWSLPLRVGEGCRLHPPQLAAGSVEAVCLPGPARLLHLVLAS